MSSDNSLSKIDTVVVIPTYNEASNIRTAIQSVLRADERLSVLVVDDGSPDGTAEVVSGLMNETSGRINLIQREGKLGLGTAYLAGFEYALNLPCDYICEMDADLSHNPEDLPRLVAPVRADVADVCIGSRYIEGVRVVNWPLSRLFLSYFAGIYTRAITRLR